MGLVHVIPSSTEDHRTSAEAAATEATTASAKPFAPKSPSLPGVAESLLHLGTAHSGKGAGVASGDGNGLGGAVGRDARYGHAWRHNVTCAIATCFLTFGALHQGEVLESAARAGPRGWPPRDLFCRFGFLHA